MLWQKEGIVWNPAVLTVHSQSFWKIFKKMFILRKKLQIVQHIQLLSKFLRVTTGQKGLEFLFFMRKETWRPQMCFACTVIHQIISYPDIYLCRSYSFTLTWWIEAVFCTLWYYKKWLSKEKRMTLRQINGLSERVLEACMIYSTTWDVFNKRPDSAKWKIEFLWFCQSRFKDVHVLKYSTLFTQLSQPSSKLL